MGQRHIRPRPRDVCVLGDGHRCFSRSHPPPTPSQTIPSSGPGVDIGLMVPVLSNSDVNACRTFLSPNMRSGVRVVILGR